MLLTIRQDGVFADQVWIVDFVDGILAWKTNNLNALPLEDLLQLPFIFHLQPDHRAHIVVAALINGDVSQDIQDFLRAKLKEQFQLVQLNAEHSVVITLTIPPPRRGVRVSANIIIPNSKDLGD